ncbi:unnamed protein product, partial [Phaeothamnion confervicola]
KAEAAVNAYQRREEEQFFASKGIEADADSFDWAALRRNTQILEKYQRRGVEEYWAKKG